MKETSLQVVLPPRLPAPPKFAPSQPHESLAARLARILAAHYRAPDFPPLTTHQRRRLLAAARNHESLEDVAKTLRLTPFTAYHFIDEAVRDGRLPSCPITHET